MKRKKEQAVKFVAAEGAPALRPAPPVYVYPPGSMREKRQTMALAAEEVRKRLKECKVCAATRAEVHRLLNEAEAMFPACIEETHAEQGKVSHKKIVYTQRKEEPDSV